MEAFGMNGEQKNGSGAIAALRWLRAEYLPRLRACWAQQNDGLLPRGGVIADGAGADGWPGCQFNERFLQIIWNERHLAPALTTVSGQALQVISPGVWNVSGGPDFRDASLVIAGRLLHGDVEIHRRSSDWQRHGHQQDPAYDRVILHAVWQNDAAPPRAELETLVLSEFLSPAWEKLLWQMEDACYPYARQVRAGACALRWALTDDEQLRTILNAAGLARLESKGLHLLRSAAELGADQAIYVGFFDCLGYKNNREAFRALAEAAPLERLRALPSDEDREALLFGMAGLLPDPTKDEVLPEWRAAVAELWQRWWRCGHSRLELNWHRGSTRPYNSPQRRLAAGLSWLRRVDYRPAQWLQQLAASSSTARTLRQALQAPLTSAQSWRGYRDFGHAIKPAADLLGPPRLLDIAANLFLPYLNAQLALTAGADSAAAQCVRDAYMLLPPSQENRLLKEAIQRFLTPPSRSRELIRTVCHQQGLMDIYKNFCLALDNNCDSCPFRGAAAGDLP
jgi:hypothetical protein